MQQNHFPKKEAFSNFAKSQAFFQSAFSFDVRDISLYTRFGWKNAADLFLEKLANDKYDTSILYDKHNSKIVRINIKEKSELLGRITFFEKMKYFMMKALQFTVRLVSSITTPIAWTARCLFRITKGMAFSLYGMGEFFSDVLKHSSLFQNQNEIHDRDLDSEFDQQSLTSPPNALNMMQLCIEIDLMRGSIDLELEKEAEYVFYPKDNSEPMNAQKILEIIEKSKLSSGSYISIGLIMTCLQARLYKAKFEIDDNLYELALLQNQESYNRYFNYIYPDYPDQKAPTLKRITKEELIQVVEKNASRVDEMINEEKVLKSLQSSAYRK